MRDYQRATGGKYILPRAVYNQTIWIIRDYTRMTQEAAAIMTASPAPPDGQPRGTVSTDDTASRAVKRALYLDRIRSIDRAFETIPPEYRRGVWASIQTGDPYPQDAARETYSRMKSKFILQAALNLHLY